MEIYLVVFGKRMTELGGRLYPDLEEYMSKERGFTFDFRELPSPIAKNNEELIAAIGEYDEEKYAAEMRRLNELVGYFGGDAAAACKDRIFGWLDEGEKD